MVGTNMGEGTLFLCIIISIYVPFAVVVTTSIDEGIPLVNNVLETIAAGVSVSVSSLHLKLGTVTFPFDLLCKVGDIASSGVSCRVCDLDCVHVHNASGGGRCGPHPDPQKKDTTVCLCDYGKVHHKDEMCAKSYIPLAPQLDGELDFAVKGFLLLRFQTLLCLLDGKGICPVECQINHGAKTGKCIDKFCICEY